MSITWLNRSFEGPFRAAYFTPPSDPALFAVMIKPDPKNAPNAYRILFFGQTTRLSAANYLKSHKKFECWRNYAGTFENLFVGFHAVPGSSMEEREEALKDLIDHYKPVCNF